jgi:twitching motility protein PilT
MDVKELLKQAVTEGASDIFIVAGRPVSYRKGGVIENLSDQKLFPADTEDLLKQIYELDAQADFDKLSKQGDDDFSFAVPGLSRFRVNAFKQRGTLSAVIRIITFDLPSPDKLGIPSSIIHTGDYSKGLVLVTGPAGSGKSTTLACIIDYINKNKQQHIITLEDPLEFLHRHDQSIVSQREISVDTESYVTALRASLRQSPDVILLGEMRDYETIDVVITAAETGHLIFSTLHTLGAANAIDRIIDVFPASEQNQIAIQLSMVLQAVVSMQLVPDVNGKLVSAFEIMTVTPAIRNMIRENKVPQIDGMLYSSNKEDMISMDNSLLNLYKAGRITKETAIEYATNPEMLKRKL